MAPISTDYLQLITLMVEDANHQVTKDYLVNPMVGDIHIIANDGITISIKAAEIARIEYTADVRLTFILSGDTNYTLVQRRPYRIAQTFGELIRSLFLNCKIDPDNPFGNAITRIEESKNGPGVPA